MRHNHPPSPPPLPFPKLQSSCSGAPLGRAATSQFGEGKREGREGGRKKCKSPLPTPRDNTSPHRGFVQCSTLHVILQDRQRRDSNPCGQSPMDFESISLTARTQCLAGHAAARLHKLRSLAIKGSCPKSVLFNCFVCASTI